LISARRRWWLTGLAGLVAGLGSACAPALAVPPHLIAAWPAPGQTVTTTASHLELTFNRPAAGGSSVVQVIGEADGHVLATQTRAEERPNTLDVVLAEEPPPGWYIVRWHAVNARTRAAEDGEYPFRVQPEGNISPHLDLARDAIGNGEVINIKGQGFAPRAQVRLTVGDDDLPLKTVAADARGGFNEDARIPASVAFGVQPVSGVDAAGNRATAALKVRWGGWPPVLAWTVGQPGPGIGQVTLILTLRNRSDYVLEGLHVAMSVAADASFVAADQGGRFADGVLSWDLGWLDRGVAGPLRATFRADAPISSHATIQFRHRRPHGCEDDDCLTAFVSETTSDSAPVAPLQALAPV
jgi:methionine-rich copper-binding protein CopC